MPDVLIILRNIAAAAGFGFLVVVPLSFGLRELLREAREFLDQTVGQ